MTPTPWKAQDIPWHEWEDNRFKEWARVFDRDGYVIIPCMNRVDAHHLVKCVNQAEELHQRLFGRPLMT